MRVLVSYRGKNQQFKVGTANNQSQGLQVLGIDEPWPIYLEGIEECYILEPLMIWGLSHGLNLGMSFLTRNNLKLVCTMHGGWCFIDPVKDGSASRARLVDGGCKNFANQRSRKVWRAIKEQKISTQVWRIPLEKINIYVLKERKEEDVGVYTKKECSIPTGTGKYIPLQTNREITGDVLIEISDNTMTGLILPKIVYNVKKKLGCIFRENHNSEPLD